MGGEIEEESVRLGNGRSSYMGGSVVRTMTLSRQRESRDKGRLLDEVGMHSKDDDRTKKRTVFV